MLTGCAGFIGSHLLDRLLKDGHTVIGIDDFNNYYSPKQKRKNVNHNLSNPKFTLIEQDITSQDLFNTIVRSEADIKSIEMIVHLAARAGVRSSIKYPLLYEKVNISGTLRMLEIGRRLKVKHFIFGSSSSVYGNNTPAPFSEDAPCDQPISPYAATKRSAELLCYTYHHLYQIPVTVLRFFTVYGPRNRPDMAAFKFTDKIACGQPIDIYGQGTSRDYTYVGDIIDGVVAALSFPQPKFDTINLGNSSPVKLTDFISTIEAVVGKNAIINQKPLPPGDVTTTYADISKAKSILAWQPKTTLKNGLTKLWHWYQKTAK